jgi:RNA-directed DNA polymerase
MSRLQSLQSATSIQDVAALLKYKARTVAYILYRKPDQNKYHSFEIRKRGGGARQINSPSDDLKLLQRNLSDLLQDCAKEINDAGSFKDQLAHGFKRKRSIIDNATKHRRRQYVLNLDLQDFFGAINFGRVRGFFIKDSNFALRPEVATVLAQIACHKNALPQGSPCSPVISNLIGHIMDLRLVRLAFDNGCTYSRYADDLTFSTNKKDFPSDIARLSTGKTHAWELGDGLQRIITRSGFTVNPDKTRMQYRTSRQEVTGLVVNRKVNIRSDYRRTVRAMADRLFRTGKFQLIETVRDPIDPRILVPTTKDGTLPQLHGMLGHIDHVDLHNAKIAKKSGQPINIKASINSKENLYRRFLMFKEFYVASAPVIVCEGKTDSVYLKCAIRSLAAAFPALANVVPGKPIAVSVRIPRYPVTPTGRILKLTGSSSFLQTFIPAYMKEMKKFKAPGMQHPVILLVDNDDGANPVFNSVKEAGKPKPTGKEQFVHIAGNLYLVATPLSAGATSSMIEDAFGVLPTTLKIGGKSFNPDDKTFDTALHYDKHIFSEYVKDKASQIDFTGFTELLNRLAAVIEAHKAAVAATNGKPQP